MREWDILIEGTADRTVDEALADAIIEHLAPYGPAVGYRDVALTLGFTLIAENAGDAARLAYRAFVQAQSDVHVRHLSVSVSPNSQPNTDIVHSA